MVGIDRRRVRLSLIAAVVIGGVLGSLLPAAAGPAAVTSVGGLEPAELTAIDIDGPYAFVSLGVTGAKWSHRSTLTADGRLSAFRPSYEHPDYGIQDDHLELIDTITGARRRLTELDLTDPFAQIHHPPECVAVSGDGSTVVFDVTADGLGASPPEEHEFGSWGYAHDVATGELTALPLPDPSLRDPALDGLCPLDVSHDGQTVLFALWGQLFLAELGLGDPVARRLLELPEDESAVRPLRAEMDAAGQRIVVEHPATPGGDAIDTVTVYDVGSELVPVWSSGLGDEDGDAGEDGRTFTGFALSADGSTLTWVEQYPEWAVEAERAFYVLDLTDPDPSPARVLLPPEPARPGWSPLPSWATDVALSADGSSVFVAGRHRVHRYIVTTGAFELVADTSPLDSGELIEDPEHGDWWESCEGCRMFVHDLQVSADGATVLFTLMDRHGHMADSSEPAEVVVGRLADQAPPAWPAAAEVRAPEVAATFATVEWDAATDDIGVAGYDVLVDGAVVATTGASTRTERLLDLQPDNTYEVGVVAFDAAGGRSPALVLSLRTAPLGDLAPLTATAQPDGTVDLRWDPAADDPDEYVVLRAVGGEPTTVGETTAASFVDTAVPAGAEVSYQIQARRGDATVDHTSAVSVTTSPIPEPTVRWTNERFRGGQVVLGSEVTVTVFGQPHRLASARLEGVDPAGEPAAVDVSLVPAAEGDGTYVGVIPALSGLATVERVLGTLSDGVGHDVTGRVLTTGLPAAVSGAIRFEPTSALPLEGSSLDVSSRRAGFSTTRPLAGTEAVEVPVVISEDYEVTVWRPDGAIGGRAHGLAVTSGAVTPVPLTVRHPASLDVTVVDEHGLPMGSVRVDVSRPGSGATTRAVTRFDGRVVSTGWNDGDELTVRLTSHGRPVNPTTVHLVPEPGTNEVTLSPDLVGDAVVHGRVVDQQSGQPRRNVTVTVSQVIHGASVLRTVRTDDDGRYSLTGVEGPARVHIAEMDGARWARDVVLGPEPLELDVVLETSISYRINVDARFRAPGQDWTDLVHGFGNPAELRIYGGRGGQHGAWIRGSTSYPAFIGDVITVCSEYFVRTCSAPITLGEDRNVDVALDVEAASRLLVQVVAPGGAPLIDFHTRISAHSEVNQPTYQRRGDRFTAGHAVIDVGAPGYYVIQASGAWHDEAGNIVHGSASTGVHLAEGELRDLPLLVLRPPGPINQLGTMLSSTKPTVMPGELFELRAELGLAEPLADVTARLALPPGFEAVSVLGSTMSYPGAGLHWREVDFEQHDDVVSVPIGSWSSTTSRRLLRIAVRTPADQEPGATQPFIFDVSSGGSTWHAASATVDIEGLTLVGPSRYKGGLVTVSGRAPAGSRVTVFEGSAAVGVAEARPGGTWSAEVALSRRAAGAVHLLTAEADIDGELQVTPPLGIAYEPNLPMLTSVEMVGQSDSRTFAVEGGIARFPFVTGPYDNVTIALGFDSPGVEAGRIGYGAQTKGFSSDDGMDASFRNAEGRQGAIFVDYTAKREEMGLDDPRWSLPRDEDEATEVLPPGFLGAEVISRTEQQLPDGSAVVDVEVSLPSMPDEDGAPTSAHVELTVSETPHFEPTEAELAAAEASGSPITAARMSLTDDGRGLIVDAIIPGEELDNLDLAALGLVRGAQPAIGPASVGVASRLSLAFRLKFFFSGEPVAASFAAGGKYDDILGLLDGVDALGGCGLPQSTMDRYYDRVNELQNNAYIKDGYNAVVAVTGLALAPATFGLGTAAVWAFGFATDAVLSSMLESQIDDLASELARQGEECEAKRTNPRALVAVPTHIWDPSGFVYEAVEDNRLSGVTTTVSYAPTPDGPWEVWDAEWFGQENPLVTDAEGRYAWDVPEGFWQVRYEKEGYHTAYSGVLEVLPPHFDVNEGLVSTAAPTFDDATGHAEELLLELSQPMLTHWMIDDQVEVLDASGAPIAGTVSPVDPADTPDGDAVARTFRFVPDEPLAVGSEVVVTVLAGARNYGDRPLGADASRKVTIAEAPGPDPDPDPADPDPEEPGGPTLPPPSGFVDVPRPSFFARAVDWAKAQGITTGVGGGNRFEPYRDLTRAEAITMLWRTMGRPGGGHELFRDVPAGAYYSAAVRWAHANGITTGVGGSDRFEPHRAVTRAEMVAFLWRAAGRPRASAARFSDVPAGTWFTAPVAWARRGGITTGVGGTNSFQPLRPVTRAEAVTFLHRHWG